MIEKKLISNRNIYVIVQRNDRKRYYNMNTKNSRLIKFALVFFLRWFDSHQI